MWVQIKGLLVVYAMCHVTVTSFNESINVKNGVIASLVMSPYTLAIMASLNNYHPLSP